LPPGRGGHPGPRDPHLRPHHSGTSRRDGRAHAPDGQAVAALGLDGIKIHLLYVVRGTRLARLHQQGEYRCLTQSDYADRVCDVLERLPPQMVIQRLTGDPHPEELVAPDWALRKRDTLALIHRRLEERETFQGRLYNSAAGPAEKTEA
ncbi:MAG: hypothetical protein PHF66_13940, partial [Desulfobacteraceae bacterium]|nr:hypothetical protein [Desulfobacteraceae bacterium]